VWFTSGNSSDWVRNLQARRDIATERRDFAR